MDFHRLSLTATITEDLLAHVRDGDHLFPDARRAHATYDTTFFGCFRVEVDLGSICRVAIEHVGGAGAFEWIYSEADRRRPSTRSPAAELMEPPTQDEVGYRVGVFDADPEQGRLLLEAVQALDWGEPTPEGDSGRDGVVLFGSLTTEAGARTWTTWSPDEAVEPAKNAFFRLLLRFAIDHSSGPITEDLARVTI